MALPNITTTAYLFVIGGCLLIKVELSHGIYFSISIKLRIRYMSCFLRNVTFNKLLHWTEPHLLFLPRCMLLCKVVKSCVKFRCESCHFRQDERICEKEVLSLILLYNFIPVLNIPPATVTLASLF